jgi:hypothetical protein
MAIFLGAGRPLPEWCPGSGVIILITFGRRRNRRRLTFGATSSRPAPTPTGRHTPKRNTPPAETHHLRAWRQLCKETRLPRGCGISPGQPGVPLDRLLCSRISWLRGGVHPEVLQHSSDVGFILRTSASSHVPTILRSATRLMATPARMTWRPVAGMPMSSAVCLPRTVHRVAPRSAFAIWSSIRAVIVGQAAAIGPDHACKLLAPLIYSSGVDDEVPGE